ncbi:MAG: PocR ligand-binding domain-containing protein [Oscillospiraceae bacterium]|nr:PocR ligand-binding domain-containing protein [Oscillospiraceae bacterium]
MLQRIQNAFSDLTGMAALTTDCDGVAITHGSNFADFCNMTRATELGRKRCELCDINGAKLCIARNDACSYKCHAGLVDYAAPIVVNNELIGSFIGGQILVEPPDLDKIRATAMEIGVDPDEYESAVKKIRIVSRDLVDKAARFQAIIASTLSNIAYKGYELNQKNIEIEKASHMKSDFLANMSHEIRTPMNAVIGLSELALREEMSLRARDYIHQIKASSKNLLVIINDILDFSKIESGKMDIIEIEYTPLSIFNDLTGVINSRIGNKDIEFTMDIPADLPKILYGDNIRIHQIVLNLLTNAVKFTEQGEVHLKIEFIRKNDDMGVMRAEVSDTGIGIKQEDIHKLFNSFQQVDSKRNRNIEGTGLGLAISQQLLNLMGGKISLKSEYNKGSTFFFELPQKIVDTAPMVPQLEKRHKVAVLIENQYVKKQLIRDLEQIGADHVDLADVGNLEDLNVDFFIVGKLFSSQMVQDYVKSRPDMQCVVLADYDHIDVINIPNVRTISKPAYSLSLYNAMGIKDINFEINDLENDDFPFIAPEAHILIVDDNSVNLTVASGLLEPLKMKIDTASSAAEAIEMIHQMKYDIIFMDHMMPDVDGVEATHIIRQLVPGYDKVPIIALTANAIGGAREMFIREGMNDFIPKPIDIKNALPKIRRWLPKEKIVPVNKTEAADADMQDASDSGDMNSDILNIGELNIKQAVQRLGSEKLYLTVLKEYFGAIDKKYSVIREHKEAGRWHDYTVEVHSLKSTSRQIGADHLADLSAELEKAGNDGNIAMINEKTDEMLMEYMRLKDILKPYFPDASNEDDGQIAGSEEIVSMLERMQSALDTFDTLEIDEIIEEMSQYKYEYENEEFFERLQGSASASDIDGCLNIVTEWRKALMNPNDGEKVLKLLDELQNALDEFDTLEIDAVVEKMSHRSFSDAQREYFDQLRGAAENSDIDKCAEIIAKWRSAVEEKV